MATIENIPENKVSSILSLIPEAKVVSTENKQKPRPIENGDTLIRFLSSFYISSGKAHKDEYGDWRTQDNKLLFSKKDIRDRTRTFRIPDNKLNTVLHKLNIFLQNIVFSLQNENNPRLIKEKDKEGIIKKIEHLPYVEEVFE